MQYRIALPYPNMTYLPYYVAVDKGFCADENVNFEYFHVKGGKTAINKLFLNGEIDFLYALWEMVELNLEGHGEIKGLCGNVAESNFLFVRPEIKTAADLKSKTIIAGVAGSGSEVQVRYGLKLADLDPDKDVNLIGGDYIERVHAFENAAIDGCQDRLQTWYFAKKAGWNYLKFPDPSVLTDSGGLSTTLKMIKENPEVVGKVVKAIVRATKFIKENREEAIDVASKLIDYMSREDIAGQYDILRDCYSADIAPVSINFMVAATADFLNVQNRPKFEDLVELSFLNKAKAELGL
ncbi:MAG: ABC transporter substrate-binding protein [Peptococcaceae bacterium]|nr:ABC transporter substrate-binding protein [Peptococcaceae bacterium]